MTEAERSNPDDLEDRRGRFFIGSVLIREHPAVVQLALCGMIVVRAESHWDRNAIEYIALSEHFDPVLEGMKTPLYAPEIHTEMLEDGTETVLIKRWVRCECE